MWARGISIDDLSAAISGGTSYTGAGQLDASSGTALLRPHGQLDSVEAYKSLDGRPLPTARPCTCATSRTSASRFRTSA